MVGQDHINETSQPVLRRVKSIACQFDALASACFTSLVQVPVCLVTVHLRSYNGSHMCVDMMRGQPRRHGSCCHAVVLLRWPGLAGRVQGTETSALPCTQHVFVNSVRGIRALPCSMQAATMVLSFCGVRGTPPVVWETYMTRDMPLPAHRPE